VSSSDSVSLAGLLNPAPIFANLWRRRALAWQFARREIEIRHRGSRLGPFWALLNPLSILLLYWFIFGLIFKGGFGVVPGETQFDFVVAMFFGLSLFHVFAETLGWSPVIISGNPNFVKKVVFPLEVLPVAKIGDAAYHLAVSLTLVIASSCFSTAGIGWSVLWLPVFVLPVLLMALGLAWALAAIGVFLRDISQLTAFISTAVMFASAVMFSPDRIRTLPQAWQILRFNPLLQVLDVGRRVVLWHEAMTWWKLGYIYACALVALVVGHALFTLLRRSFAEAI